MILHRAVGRGISIILLMEYLEDWGVFSFILLIYFAWESSFFLWFFRFSVRCHKLEDDGGFFYISRCFVEFEILFRDYGYYSLSFIWDICAAPHGMFLWSIGIISEDLEI